ncbi:Asp-tRNA(Asn)/Glu-tRNA(Gln) amidotransferase subunit GatC [Vreelandella azerica]|uniref:Asp-tRNA(Asn)/Glu-tRNA(Gln) amidotransferase subunit GatC n=1 Tax=Vreelandella azerica TaxID=2732867 RepID=UPI003BF4B58D
MRLSLVNEDVPTMALEETHVRRAAHLARLAVSDDQAKGFVDDLGQILEMVDQLQRVDTQGVAPWRTRLMQPSACAPMRSPKPISVISSSAALLRLKTVFIWFPEWLSKLFPLSSSNRHPNGVSGLCMTRH